MTMPQDSETFLRSVEQFAGKSFRYRREILELLDLSLARSQRQLFDDLVFNAKFITNALNILKRVGADNADAAKLGAELGEMMEKTTTLLRTIIKEAPEGPRQHFLDSILALNQGAMTNLTGLLAELSWVKNYQLDHRPPR